MLLDATGLVAAPGATRAAAGTTVTAAEAVLPANAAANTLVYLYKVSCASAGNCTAVGSYSDNSGSLQGLLLTETSGSWTAGVEATLPANALTAQDARATSVSCASAGNCTAVGFYNDDSGPNKGLLLTQTSGTWTAGVEATLPANAAPNSGSNPLSVSCASPGNCTAVGSYTDSSGSLQGLLLTQTSGTWAAGVQAVPPANAGPDPNVSLNSVSCAPAGNCTAVGSYTDSSGSLQGLLLTQASGTWTAAEAPLPAGAGNSAVIFSVSCASAGNCTAAGLYRDSSGSQQGFLLTQTSGTWTAAEAPLPADAAANPLAGQLAVSCVSAGNCTALGTYRDTSGNTQGVLLSQTSGTWTDVEAPLPADAAANPVVNFFSHSGCIPAGYCVPVSCASPGNCTAAGTYRDSAGNTHGLLLTQASGTWTAADAPLPADAGTDAVADVSSVSCTSPGICTAVGRYSDSSGNFQGLLLTQTQDTQPTTTALVSAPDPSAAGQAVTYTATVSPAPGGGTVAFTDGTSVIAGCAAQPVGASTSQATCQTATGTAGANNITAVFSGSGDFAASTSPVRTQVITTKPCPSLAGCNLSGLSLANAHLPGANLNGANLKDTNLNGADLTGANLTGANLTGANLDDANLTGANLPGANLTGANLNGANLNGANLSGARVTGANFAKVTWSSTTCPDGTNSNADGGTCAGYL